MNALFLPIALSPGHIILVVIVILLLFGGRKIPELMKGLGSGLKEFKNASKDDPAPIKPEHRAEDPNPEKPTAESQNHDGKI